MLEIYKSSAGSGKTYTLVQKYLRIVFDNPKNFRNILAITFTNKAAFEMKERIINALKNISQKLDVEFIKDLTKDYSEEVVIEKSKEILNQILHNYSYFSVMTIDSFIYKIVKSHSLELDLPLHFDVDLKEEQLLYKIVDIIIEKIGKINFDEQTKVMNNFVINKIQKGLSWDIHKNIKDISKEIFKEEGKFYLRELRKIDVKDLYNENIRKIEGLMTSLKTKIKQLIVKAEKNELKHELSNKILIKKLTELSEADVDKLLKEYQNSANVCEFIFGELLKDSLNDVILINTFNLINENYYEMFLIKEIEEVLQKYKIENKIIPISDFNSMLSQIIKEEEIPDIFYKVGTKYTNYLIDEFQDTSKMQWENIKPLLEETLSSQEKRKNLVVGDTKQAIYGWRGSYVEIMDDVKKAFSIFELKEESLNKNYRSSNEIINFNNSFFEKVKNNIDEPVIKNIYKEVKQEIDKNIPGYVEVEVFNLKEKKEEFEEYSIEKTINLVKKLTTELNYKYSDITVLVRKNEEARKVVKALFQNNIEAISSESLLIYKEPVIIFLLNIINYLISPNDEANKISIVTFYRKIQFKEEISNTLLEIEKNKENYFDLLMPKNFLNNIKRFKTISIYDSIEEIIRIFELNKKNFAAYLQRFLDIIGEFQGKDFIDFIDWFEEEKDNISLLVPEKSNAVEVLTIHKAKGLQFEIVIIPFAAWSTENIKNNENVWLSHKYDPIKYLLRSKKIITQSLFQDNFKYENLLVFIDNLNLLYVAFTRAVKNLYITTYIKSTGQEIIQNDDSLDEIENVNEIITKVVKTMNLNSNSNSESVLYTSGTELKCDDDQNKSKNKTYKFDNFISTNWNNTLDIKKIAPQYWVLDNTYLHEKINYGNLIHQLLAKVKYEHEINTVLNQFLLDGIIPPKDKDAVIKQIDKLFQNKTVKKWFSEIYKVKNESTILTDNGILKPDRILFDENNNVTIIDYKTGFHSNHNIEQMKNYIKTLKSMNYDSVEGFLLYIHDEIKIIKIEE